MKRISTLLAVTILIATISSTAFAGSITTLRSSRTGSITTLSRGSITTLRTGSITTLRSGSITTLSTSETGERVDRFSMSELFGSYASFFISALW